MGSSPSTNNKKVPNSESSDNATTQSSSDFRFHKNDIQPIVELYKNFIQSGEKPPTQKWEKVIGSYFNRQLESKFYAEFKKQGEVNPHQNIILNRDTLKKTFDNYKEYTKTRECMLEYWNFLETICDPKKLYNKYYENRDYSLELFEIALFYNKMSYHYIKGQSDKLKNENSELKKPICRIVVCSQNNTNPFLSLLPQREYGFNHLAIQIGLLLIHWYDISFPIIEPLVAGSVNTCAMIYPNSVLENNVLNEESVQKVCEITAKWAREYNYDVAFCNCQDFIKEILKGLELNGLQKSWIKQGPIQMYLKMIANPKNNHSQITIYDIFTKKYLPIKYHQDLREYYMHKLQPEQDKIQPENDRENLYKEMLQIIKCIERSMEVKGVKIVNPIFPHEPGQVTYGLT